MFSAKLKSVLFCILVLSQSFLFTTPAHAYIGPGMAGGVFAAILGFFGAICLLVIGVVYFPIKRFLNNRKAKSQKTKK